MEKKKNDLESESIKRERFHQSGSGMGGEEKRRRGGEEERRGGEEETSSSLRGAVGPPRELETILDTFQIDLKTFSKLSLDANLHLGTFLSVRNLPNT